MTEEKTGSKESHPQPESDSPSSPTEPRAAPFEGDRAATDHLPAPHERNPFKVIASRKVYENPWIRVAEHDIEKPRGGPGIYGVVHFKNRAVGVVAYDHGYVYLVGQYRFPLDLYSWEIPEGGAPYGEDPADCARRELAEETGLRAGKLERLLCMHLSNSVSDEVAYIYLATELQPGTACPEDTELLQMRRLLLDEVYAMVENGTITDAISVAAVLRLMLLRHEGRL